MAKAVPERQRHGFPGPSTSGAASRTMHNGVPLTAAVDPHAAHRPLDLASAGRRAMKQNAVNGRGSRVAAVKRLQTKDKTLSAMLEEATEANCDGALSVELATGSAPVGNVQFTLLDFKRMISGRNRRRRASRGKERTQSCFICPAFDVGVRKPVSASSNALI